MSMKKDLTGESIHLVDDETPEEDRIPESMIEDVPEPFLGPDEVCLRILDAKDGATIPLDRHEPFMKGFMNHHGLMFDPNRPGRFPSSRDWNMPDIECDRKTCAANYKGKCVMPSCIKIGANGKCKGCHDRKSGKKK